MDYSRSSAYIQTVSHKSARIAEMTRQHEGRGVDARYLGYFECFNLGQFYEAHDVLEDLWLLDKKGPEGNFYKGLIQLAGAFVHLQKNRLGPSDALFKLAEANLVQYPARHHHLDLAGVLKMISWWRERLRLKPGVNPLGENPPPRMAPELPTL